MAAVTSPADLHPRTLRFRPPIVEARLAAVAYRRLCVVHLGLCAAAACVALALSVAPLWRAALLFVSRGAASYAAEIKLERRIGVCCHCLLWVFYLGSYSQFEGQAEGARLLHWFAGLLFVPHLHLFTVPAEVRWLLVALLAAHLRGQIEVLAVMVCSACICHYAERQHRRKLLYSSRLHRLNVDCGTSPLVPSLASSSCSREAPTRSCSGGKAGGCHATAVAFEAQGSNSVIPLQATQESGYPVVDEKVAMLVSRLAAYGCLEISGVNDLELLQQLGRGTFGVATLCRSREGRELMVLKKISLGMGIARKHRLQLVSEVS